MMMMMEEEVFFSLYIIFLSFFFFLIPVLLSFSIVKPLNKKYLQIDQVFALGHLK